MLFDVAHDVLAGGQADVHVKKIPVGVFHQLIYGAINDDTGPKILVSAMNV